MKATGVKWRWAVCYRQPSGRGWDTPKTLRAQMIPQELQTLDKDLWALMSLGLALSHIFLAVPPFFLFEMEMFTGGQELGFGGSALFPVS